jgi:DNA-binding beta-propeller fold protein YncE
VTTGIATSGNGKTVYALTGAFQDFSGIVVIDTATLTITGHIPLPSPLGEIAVSPDGLTAYVTGGGSTNYLTVVDLAQGQISGQFPVPGPVYSIVSPDGKYIYVGTDYMASITVLDRATGSVLSKTPVPPSVQMALTADGSTIYTSGSAVTVFDTATRAVVNSIQTAGATYGIAAQ